MAAGRREKEVPAAREDFTLVFCSKSRYLEKVTPLANTKSIEDREERKKVKRAARKKAPAKGPRAGARGENKAKIKKASRGQSKR